MLKIKTLKRRYSGETYTESERISQAVDRCLETGSEDYRGYVAPLGIEGKAAKQRVLLGDLIELLAEKGVISGSEVLELLGIDDAITTIENVEDD